MNKTNRLCALAVILAILSGMLFLQAVEAAASDDGGFELVKSLGAFDHIEITNPDDLMTGKDFAAAMENITGISNMHTNIAVGNTADDRVVFVGAVKVIVDILGYGVRAEMDGGYPVGYLAQALKLKIINDRNISVGRAISFRDFATLIENSFEVDLLTQTVYGDNKTTYISAKGENFLTKIMGIKKVENRQMTGNNVTGMTSQDGLGDYYIEVDGITYRIDQSQAYLNKYIGRYVDLYYLHDNYENNIQPYQVKHMQLSERVDSVVINAEDIESYNDYVLSYRNEHGRLQSKRISPGAFVIRNGVKITSYSWETFDFENGSVVFTNGSGYDAVIINDYEDFVISGKVDSLRTIYNKLDNQPLYFDSDTLVFIANTDNEAMTFEDLHENDILSIARSSNGVYMDIIVSANLLRGAAITSVTNTGSHIDIEVEGQSIQIAKSFKTSNHYLNVMSSNSYDIYINAFNKAAFVEAIPSSLMAMGYLVDVKKDDGLGVGLTLKIFKADGKMETFNTAEKVRLGFHDGSEVKQTSEKAYTLLKDNKNEVIWFKLDETGVITYVNFALTQYNPDMPDRYHKIRRTNAPVTYKSTHSIMQDSEGRHIAVVPGNVVIMLIPKDTDAYDDYKVASKNSFFTGSPAFETGFDGYSNDPDSLWLNLMVVKNHDRSISVSEQMVMVTKVNGAMDDEGNLLRRVRGMQAGNEVVLDSLVEVGGSAFEKAYSPIERVYDDTNSSLEPISQVYSIKPGDVIRYDTSPGTGYVDDVQIIWRADIENPAFPGGVLGNLVGTTGKIAAGTAINSNPYMVEGIGIIKDATSVFYGWAYKKSGTAVLLTTQDLSSGSFNPNATEFVGGELINAGTYGRFTVADLSTANIACKQGTVADILPYTDVGQACSRVIIIVTGPNGIPNGSEDIPNRPRSMIVLNGQRP